MAMIGSDQVTIVDLTDGYTVSMAPESYSFPAGTTNALAGSIQTTISALQGTEPIDANVVLGEVTSPTGITVTKDTNTSTPTLTITIATSVTQPGVVVIPVHVGEVTITKKFAYSLAKTGSQGSSGTSPINVITGADSMTVPTNAAGSTTGASTVTVPFAAYQGTTRIAATAAVTGTPTGISSGTITNATTSADGAIPLNIASGSNLGGASSGEFTITITAGGQTFVRKFGWSKALAGTGGNDGTSPRQVIVGKDDVSFPSSSEGVVSPAQTVTIPFAGYQGTTRIAATVAVGSMPAGMSVQTNTSASASADGSLVLAVANNSTLGGGSVRSGQVQLTFTAGGQEFIRWFSWSKTFSGADGSDGADAILLAVSSSNGTIFKNTSVATTLTARVFKGGVEVTGAALTALGTINWYKDGGSTPVGTGASLVISAGQVTNKAIYEARLES